MRSHPILRFLLPASLTLNAFLAGLALQMWHDSPRPGPPHPERMIEEMAATLPAADAKILRDSFAAHSTTLGMRPKNRDDVVQRIRAVLRDDPFDPQALALILKNGRKARNQIDDVIDSTLVEATAKMSPQGRHKLAEWHPPFAPPPPSRD